MYIHEGHSLQPIKNICKYHIKVIQIINSNSHMKNPIQIMSKFLRKFEFYAAGLSIALISIRR